jgi:hypothetical protein
MPYHYRDHWEALETYIATLGWVWRDEATRTADTGRKLNWEKSYTGWVRTYRADRNEGRPPLDPDQFRELVEEITQQTAEGDGDLEPLQSVEDFVLEALDASDIRYDHASGTWVSEAGLPKPYTHVEGRVLERFYELRDRDPRVRKLWPKDRVQQVLFRIVDSYADRSVRSLRERLAHNPEAVAGGVSCLRWVLEDILQVADPDTSVAVMLQWLWQVKRYLYGRTVPSPLMINLYGPQGCGKSQFVTMLTSPPGLFGEFLEVASLSTMGDSRDTDLWSSKFVVFFDELAFSSEYGNEARNLEAMKKILTSRHNSRRDLGRNSRSKMRRLFSAIAASNASIVQRLYDPTGMRRFFEIVVQRTEKMGREEHAAVFGEPTQELGTQPETAMDPLLIWQAVDEGNDYGYLLGPMRARVEEIQDGYKRADMIERVLLEADDVNVWHPYDGSETPSILEELRKFPRPREAREWVDTNRADLRLVPVSEFRRGIVQWLRDQDPGLARFVPGYDGLVHHLQRDNAYPLVEFGQRAFLLCFRDYNNPDNASDSPI